MRYIIIILLFASCNATKQSAKYFKKGIKADRVYFAKVTRDSFPCKELFKTDTALIVIDSTVYIDCPDYSNVVGKVTHDTSYIKGEIKTIKVPVLLPIRTKIITKYFEDSAKIVVAQKEAAKANEELVKYKAKATRRGNLNLYLIIALLLSALLNFIQFRRK